MVPRALHLAIRMLCQRVLVGARSIESAYARRCSCCTTGVCVAFFNYLGEPPRPLLVTSYGPTKEIAVPKLDGTRTVLTNPTGFPIGDQLPFDFVDELSLAFLDADSRFERS